VRALLIINESAGDDVPNSERIGKIRACLPSTLNIEVAVIGSPETAGMLAREAVTKGTRVILVVGGDGTVSEAAAELVGTPAVLGIIPLGTFNNIARSAGIPIDLEQACACIADGKIRKIDVGLINEEKYFFEAAGVGLDATLFSIGDKDGEAQWPLMAERVRTSWRYSPRRVQLTLDRPVEKALASGHERYRRRTLEGNSVMLRAHFVAIAIGPYYGGAFTIAPEARVGDGCLTVCVYRNFSRLELLWHFLMIARGNYRYSPKIETFHAAAINLSANTALPVHADGEVVGSTPVAVRIVPQALSVFASGGAS
jgi:diacylglycerol kinase (ATP)